MSRQRPRHGARPGYAACLAAALLAPAAGAIEPEDPPGREEAEQAQEQAQERLDLRQRQARIAAEARRDGSAATPEGAARLRESQSVERMRLQSRQEEQRYESSQRRPSIRPRYDDPGAPNR